MSWNAYAWTEVNYNLNKDKFFQVLSKKMSFVI